MSHKQKYSIHHLIPTSRWWENVDQNKQSLRDTKHVNLHRFYCNATPAEQLFEVLAINYKVWDDRFVNDIIKVLDAHFDNYYKEGTHWDIQWEWWQLMELERKFWWNN